MTWTKFSDDFTDRPLMLEVGRSARLLLVEMYVWCNRLLTDGRVPKPALRRLSDAEDVDLDAKELATAGLIDDLGDAFQLDWNDQPLKVEVEARREATNLKQKRYREHTAGRHHLCLSERCSHAVTGNSGSNKPGNEHGSVTSPRPAPTRPDPKEVGSASRERQTGKPPPHAFVDDGGGHDDCEICNLPKRNPIHGRTPHA